MVNQYQQHYYTSYEIHEISSNITQEMLANYLNSLNVTGNMEAFLNNIGYRASLNEETHDFNSVLNKKGKILVIGESQLKKDKLLVTVGKEGFDKDRFEFITRYQDAKHYPFEKLKWNEHYSAVLFGPVPHKCVDTAGYSSIINKMMSEDGYPPVIRMMAANDLKITKTSFITALRKLKMMSQN